MSSLRARLWLAFVLVVLVPVAAGAILMLTRVPSALESQVDDRLSAGRAAITEVVGDLCRTAQVGADLVAHELPAATTSAAVSDVVDRQVVGYAAVLDPAGRVVAERGTVPQLPGGAPVGAAAPAGSCVAGRDSGGSYALVTSLALHNPDGSARGTVVAGVPLPRERLRALAGGAATALTVVSRGEPVASTLPAHRAAQVAAVAERAAAAAEPVHAHGQLVTAAPSVPGGPLVVVSDDQPGRGGLVAVAAVVLLVALLVATAVAWLLAGLTTRPLVELADAAGRVAGGDLDTRIPVRSRDEVGRLAAAFNEMTDKLQSHIRALVSSRDQLRRNLARLGDTLSSTHDLDRILGVILEAAMATTNATAGAVLLVSPDRSRLELATGLGLAQRGVGETLSLPLGAGVTGRVAVRGEPLRGQVGPGQLTLSPEEPQAAAVLSAPLCSGERVVGVLNLYDPEGASEFREGDLMTIRSFAGQASVAVDNVLLHEEAQRLSITDPLTGLWNYRYLQMSLEQEIERATRFGRPLSLLMLDLDHFKAVNDAYGHQRGDAVLVELAARVHSVIREVDVFARYGGEELVLLLPETGASGASTSAERICEVVRGRPFDGHGDEEPAIRVTVSVGVSTYPTHASDGPGLIRAADEALYVAKTEGRDQWRVAATPALSGASTQQPRRR